MDEQEKESIYLLKQASFEIKNLRRTNDIQSARLEMFDSMMQLLHTKPAQESKGMSPDLVYQIDKFVNVKENEKPVTV